LPKSELRQFVLFSAGRTSSRTANEIRRQCGTPILERRLRSRPKRLRENPELHGDGARLVLDPHPILIMIDEASRVPPRSLPGGPSHAGRLSRPDRRHLDAPKPKSLRFILDPKDDVCRIGWCGGAVSRPTISFSRP